jgi:acetyl-CoA carboxylase biotin carboxyl carrier protein
MTTPEKSASARPTKVPRVNLKDLKKLIDMMRKAELSEVNIEQEGLKIALRKDEKPLLAPQMLMAAPAQMAAAPMAAPAPAPAAAPAPAPAAAPAVDGTQVNSPMVGTLYRSPTPEAPPFAKEGTRVEIGQTVCIIEAMKLMNEIKAETAGTITKFMVENAQPVEFGQPLYVIK